MLTCSLFSISTPAWGANAHADWDRIERAQQCLARHDFEGASDALGEVDAGGEACEVARQVQAQLDDAMAVHVDAEVVAFTDTQPLRWSRFRARGRWWSTPTLRLGLEGALQTVEAPQPSTPRGQVQAAAPLGWSLFGANLWLEPELAIARWTDEVLVFSGQVFVEARWLSPVRLSLRASRDQVTTTEDSIRDHILSDSGIASLRLDDWVGWYGELSYRRREYSDDNAEDAAHAWLLVPVVRGKVRLSGGYGGSYADSSRTRWDFIAQRYTPYFSPLEQWRHGPLGSVGLTSSRVSLDLKATVSWVDELDPNAEAWSVRARRLWLYGNVEGTLGVELPFCSIKASYQYEHQIFYQYHQASLSIDAPLH
jgi:hypothetical protein